MTNLEESIIKQQSNNEFNSGKAKENNTHT
jgi:hypothetical protein